MNSIGHLQSDKNQDSITNLSKEFKTVNHNLENSLNSLKSELIFDASVKNTVISNLFTFQLINTNYSID